MAESSAACSAAFLAVLSAAKNADYFDEAYPLGLVDDQRHRSAHMFSRLRRAVQPSSAVALVGSA